MSRHLRCPLGHQWQASGDTAVLCPVCGQGPAVESAGGDTIAYDKEAPAVGSPPPESQAATLGDSPAAVLPGEPEHTIEDRSAAAADSGARAVPTPSSLQVPGFEILGVLGRGGMGVVYQARQTRLGRIVALKMILAGSHASASDLVRFRAEAEAIAALRHPHIVQIYSVGTHAGRPYFVLEYVDGGNLAQKLQGRPQPPADAAALVELLARGIHAAHQAGIIHRDLKPANVLLMQDGTPRIADFGLAKRLDGSHGKTQTGTILGTPSYMAPEQAAGKKDIGPAADIYALGAILYELLTGKPPFKADTSLETVLEVISGQIVPPRRLQPTLPRDLELVCLTCLEKDPTQRYRTAHDLAEDLRRFRAGEPVRPNLLSRRQRAWKWLRRRPALLGTAAVLLVALAVVGCLYSGDAYRLARNRGQLVVATQPGVRVLLRRNGEEVAVLNEHTQLTLEAGDYDAELLDDPEGLELIDSRVTVTRNGWAVLRVLPEVVGEVAHLTGHKGPVCALGLTPDGQQALSVSGLVDGDHTLRRWELSTGKEVQRLPVPGNVRSAAFSPDGRLALLGGADGVLRLLDTNTGKQIHRIEAHKGMIASVAFAADGRRALSGGADQVVRLWDVETGKKLLDLEGHVESITCLAFSPDGKQAVSGGNNRALRRWDLEAGRGMVPLRGGQTSTVLAAAFSPDGKHLALGGEDGLIRLWDARTGKPGLRLKGHTRFVTALTFQADGQQVVSVSLDRTVRVWDVASGLERRKLTGHSDGVLAVAASTDGRHVLTGGGANFEDQVSKGRDFALRWWAVPRAHPGPALQTVEAPGELLAIHTPAHDIRELTYSPDGGSLLLSTGMDVLQLWDADSGTVRQTFSGVSGQLLGLGMSSDGQQAWAATPTGILRRWDVATGKLLQQLNSSMNPVADCLAYSADGKQVLQVNYYRAELRNLATGQLRDFTLPMGRQRTAALSPDGKKALMGGETGIVWLWQPGQGKKPHAFRGHQGLVHKVAFSPDGKQALSAGADGSVRLWDLESGDELLCLTGHKGPVTTLAFTPDGQRAATAGEDGTVRLWDLVSGQEVHQFQGHTSAVLALAFAPAGDRLASTSREHVLRIWQLPSTPSLAARGPLCQVLIDTDTPAASLVLKSEGKVVRTLHAQRTRPISLPAGVKYTVEPVGPGLSVTPEGFILEAGATVRLAVRRSPEYVGEVALLQGHTGVISALAFSSRGDRLVLGSATGKVFQWELSDDRKMHESSFLGGPIVALSPYGRRALVSQSGQGRIWDVPQARELCILEPDVPQPTQAVFLPGGEQVLAGSGQDAKLHLCAVADGKELRCFKSQLTRANCLAVSADSKWLLSGEPDGTVQLWDVTTGTEVRQFFGHRRAVTAVALSPDGRLALSASGDGTVRLWDVGSGAEVRRLVGHRGPVVAAAFTPDGKGAVSCSSYPPALFFWEVPSGRKLRVLEQGLDPLAGPRALALFAAAPGAPLLTACGSPEGSVHLWQLPAPPAVPSRGPAGELAELVVDGEGLPGSLVVRHKGGKLTVVPLHSPQQAWAGLHTAVTLDPGEYELELLNGPRGVSLSPTRVQLGPGGQGIVGIKRGPEFVGQIKGFQAGMGLGRVPLLPDSRHCLTLHRDGVPELWDLELGRKVRTFEGPADPLWSVALTADGTRAVAISRAGKLHVWEVATGKNLVRPEKPLPLPSTELALFPDGKQALANVGGRLVRIDTTTAEVVGEWSLGKPTIHGLALAPDGRLAFVTRSDGSVILWDVAAGKEVASFESDGQAATRVAFAPNGRLALAWTPGGTVHLWDVDSRKELPLPRTGLRASTATFTPDSRRLVLAWLDSSVSLWDLAAGEEVYRFLQGGVQGLAFTPDGRRLVVASTPSFLGVWQLPGPDHPAGQLAIESPSQMATTVLVKRGGKLFQRISVSYHALVELAPGEYELEVEGPPTVRIRLSAERVRIRAGRVETIHVSREPRPLLRLAPERVAAAEKELKTILDRKSDTQEERLQRRADLLTFLREHPGLPAARKAATVLARLPSPLDRLEHDKVPPEALAAVRAGKTARLPASLVAVLGDLHVRHGGPSCMDFSPDGKLLALTGPDGQVQLWDLETPRLLRTLKGPRAAVHSLAFSPDGKLLAAVGAEGMVVLWDPATGKEVRRLSGPKDAVHAVVFSPDGRRLATGGAEGIVQLWRVADGVLQEALPVGLNSSVQDMDFSPDGSLLACASSGFICLWNKARGGNRRWYGGSYQGAGRGLAFSPDGSLLASVNTAGGVTLWESAPPQMMFRQLNSAPLEARCSLAYRADGREIAAVSSRGRITCWDLETGAETRALRLPRMSSSVVQIAYSPEGRYLAVCRQDGLVLILRLALVPAEAGKP